MNGKIMLNGKAYSSSGRPSREITMAQWLALPDTKYTDGIVYYIKDVGGANQFPPLIYSDEERKVGVWRDGKPLYEKTIHFIEATEQTNKTYTTEITSLDPDHIILVNAEVKLGAEGANGWFTSPFYYDNNYNMTVTVSPGGINIYSRSWKWTECYATVRYTKTTDTPGSGTWATDGTYAKHYSTEEKVIGTWVDGKPLYERAFSKTLSGSPDSSGDSFIIAENITYIDTLVNMSGSVKKSNLYAFCSETGLIPTVGWSYSFHLKSNGQLVAWTSNNSSCYSEIAGGKAVAILQYTKTTD